MQVMLGHIRALMPDGCSDQFSVHSVGNQPGIEEMPEGMEGQTFLSPINPVCLKYLVKAQADELEVNGLCPVEAEDELVCVLGNKTNLSSSMMLLLFPNLLRVLKKLGISALLALFAGSDRFWPEGKKKSSQ